MVKAVIFDFDGLIIDTEMPWFEAYREEFLTYGVDISLEIWGKCIGTSFHVFDPFVYVEEQLKTTIDRQKIQENTRKRHTLIMQERDLRPGVREYLEEGKRLGLKIGLASSSHQDWVEKYLRRFGLLGYFDSINTADDVTHVKPDPELYLLAMSRLGVEGKEVVAFEDSLNGLISAKKAGAYCVIVPNEATGGMVFTDYDARLESMADKPLAQVIAEIEGLD